MNEEESCVSIFYHQINLFLESKRGKEEKERERDELKKYNYIAICNVKNDHNFKYTYYLLFVGVDVIILDDYSNQMNT